MNHFKNSFLTILLLFFVQTVILAQNTSLLKSGDILLLTKVGTLNEKVKIDGVSRGKGWRFTLKKTKKNDIETVNIELKEGEFIEVTNITTGIPDITYYGDGLVAAKSTSSKFIQQKAASGKGAFDDVEYLIGEERPFEIEPNSISDYNNQCYVFEIIEGKYEGKKFRADNDNKDPVIWISRELLRQYEIYLDDRLEKESLLCKVIYHSFNYEETVKKSLKLTFIK